MKKFIVLFLIFFIFCGDTSSVNELDETTTTTSQPIEEIKETEPELYVMLMGINTNLFTQKMMMVITQGHG